MALGMNPRRLSMCARAGIARGFLALNGPESLDAVVFEGTCEACGGRNQATLRDCLRQPDRDIAYKEKLGAIRCTKCRTRCTLLLMCEGELNQGYGKFHNHCHDCEDGGMCIGDVREGHCKRYGNHYFAGTMGQHACYICEAAAKGDDVTGGDLTGGVVW